ncbi:NACHT domain-containing protein [Pseudomonas sp. TH21]|uniref:NACHT domain-containing protein n=1 Tax=Pseudomonas sp. TH21 TaxID=2796387 RepID=UPI001913FD28|nr:NACHT domain-containing protein [Pseudomonas sp. TH21]MBK5480348.1 NACHT domain-containing protein [Pseudomonas sp. TH21]
MVITTAATAIATGLISKGMDKAVETVAEKSVSKLWDKILKQKWKFGTETARDALDDFIKKDFTNYFDQSVKRYLLIRTLNNQHEDVYLGEIYHPLFIENKERKIEINEDFVYENDEITNVIGVAGQGKSTILKKIFMEKLYNIDKSNKIPLFFDLRDFGGQSIKENIKKILNFESNKMKDESIDKLLSSGKILLILDGFDEVKKEERKELLRDIIDTNHRYKTQIITSSRPETEICTTQGIINFTVCYLGSADVTNMVKKLVLPEVYPHLIDALNKNKQLMSTIKTPILVILFCICEKHLDSLPKNAKEFYNRIFNILYEGHDKTKNFYNRSKTFNQPINEIREAFCCFCFISIYKNKTSMTDQEMLEISKKALKNKMLPSDSQDASNFYSDIIDITGLIRKDGYLNNTFIHKTIQEFHAAEFIRMSSSKRKKEINEMLVRESSENLSWINTSKFLYDIDKENTIEELIIPLCEKHHLHEWNEKKDSISEEYYYNYISKARAILNEKTAIPGKKKKKKNIERIHHSIEVGPFTESFLQLIIISDNKISLSIFNKALMDFGVNHKDSLGILSSLEIKKPNEQANEKNSISVRKLLHDSKREDVVISIFKDNLAAIHKDIYLYFKNMIDGDSILATNNEDTLNSLLD